MNLREQYQFYYNRIFVKFELIKQTQNQELAMLGHPKDLFPFLQQGGFEKNGICVRNINAATIDFLDRQFARYNFFAQPYRLYVSLATFQNGKFPMFSWSVAERTAQQKKFVQDFTDQPSQFLSGFTFFMEIDEKDEVKGHDAAKKIKEEFDRFGLPYSITPSGGKQGGFHFFIDYSHFAKFFTPLEMVKASFIINNEFRTIFKIDSIDTSIFDSRRLKKLCYSLTFGSNKNWNCILPLDDLQFENFDPNMIKSSSVLQNIVIKNRGLLSRKPSPTGIQDFLEEWFEPAIKSGEYSKIKDERIMGTK